MYVYKVGSHFVRIIENKNNNVGVRPFRFSLTKDINKCSCFRTHKHAKNWGIAIKFEIPSAELKKVGLCLLD